MKLLTSIRQIVGISIFFVGLILMTVGGYIAVDEEDFQR